MRIQLSHRGQQKVDSIITLNTPERTMETQIRCQSKSLEGIFTWFPAYNRWIAVKWKHVNTSTDNTRNRIKIDSELHHKTMYLRTLDTISRFATIYYMGYNICDILFAFLHTMIDWVEVLWPSQPLGSCRVQSVYLTILFLDKLSPLSG